ncbi:hypothetical protein D3C81_2135410 [compost metagenome]
MGAGLNIPDPSAVAAILDKGDHNRLARLIPDGSQHLRIGPELLLQTVKLLFIPHGCRLLG